MEPLRFPIHLPQVPIRSPRPFSLAQCPILASVEPSQITQVPSRSPMLDSLEHIHCLILAVQRLRLPFRFPHVPIRGPRPASLARCPTLVSEKPTQAPTQITPVLSRTTILDSPEPTRCPILASVKLTRFPIRFPLELIRSSRPASLARCPIFVKPKPSRSPILASLKTSQYLICSLEPAPTRFPIRFTVESIRSPTPPSLARCLIFA